MARTPGVEDAIGFSVPKDFQNRPVRKIDFAWQREMWWSVLFVSALVGGLLTVAWQHSQWRDLGYDVNQAREALAAAETENRHLRVERDTLSMPQRIERLAITDLHLVAPLRTEAVVLERVRQAVAPARTLVARR